MRLWRSAVLLAAGFITLSVSDPARIARVESGLLPAQVIKGTPVSRYSITERLAHYKVPGVSVAVFDNADLAWARGYGVVEEGT